MRALLCGAQFGNRVSLAVIVNVIENRACMIRCTALYKSCLQV